MSPPHASSRSTVAAVILAAGRSTRMGTSKPLLPFAGTRVIEHVVASLRTAGMEPVHVVVGHRGDAVARALAGRGAIVVDNPDFDLGMYSSIRAGIASLPATVAGTLLLPVDVPAVRPATFALIAEAGLARGAIVHPTFRGERGHPPFLPRSLFAEIVTNGGDGGLAALLRRHDDEAGEIAVVDRACLHDMDHPADHERLAAALPHRHVPEPEECDAILEAQAVEPRIRRHCRAVADFAVAMAERLIAAGMTLDLDLVRAGGLVHDVAKGHPHHAEIGAAMLRELGFPSVADVVARHMRLDFVEGDPIDEAVVVHLADKLIDEERRVTLTERFAAAERRFRDDPAALAGARRRHAAARAALHAVEARIDLPEPASAGDPAPSFFVEARIVR